MKTNLKNFFEEIDYDSQFLLQAHLMSLVLKKQKTNVLTVLDYNLITREAVSKVTNFIRKYLSKNYKYLNPSRTFFPGSRTGANKKIQDDDSTINGCLLHENINISGFGKQDYVNSC